MNTFRKTLANILAVAGKEIALLFKDLGFFFVILILPLTIASVLGSAYPSGDATIQLPVVLVNLDAGAYGAEIASILEGIEELDLTAAVTEADGQQAVVDGEALAAVIIPADFSQKIDAYQPTAVTVSLDPTQTQYATVITTIMEDVVDPVAVAGEIQYGAAQVLAEFGGNDTPQAQTAAGAQTESIIRNQMEDMRENPRVSVVQESIEGPDAMIPDNLFAMFVPGFTVMFGFFMVPIIAKEMLVEKEAGTLRRLVAAPISKGELIAGKMVSYVLIVLLQVTLIFGVSAAVFQMPLGDSVLGLFLTALAMGVAAAALGMMLAAFARSNTQADSLGTLLTFVLAGLGGCIQIGVMPLFRSGGTIGFLSRLTPQAHALESFRRLMIEGGTLVQALPQIGILGGMALVFFLIAVLRFRFE